MSGFSLAARLNAGTSTLSHKKKLPVQVDARTSSGYAGSDAAEHRRKKKILKKTQLGSGYKPTDTTQPKNVFGGTAQIPTTHADREARNQNAIQEC